MDQQLHFDPDCAAEVVSGGELEKSGKLPVKKSYDGFGSEVYTEVVCEGKFELWWVRLDSLDGKIPRAQSHYKTHIPISHPEITKILISLA